MKAYGRHRQHPGNYPDNHPQKGYINWWEDENPRVKSKKCERQDAKAEIEREIVTLDDELFEKIE